jgi:hypothetical protein
MHGNGHMKCCPERVIVVEVACLLTLLRTTFAAPACVCVTKPAESWNRSNFCSDTWGPPHNPKAVLKVAIQYLESLNASRLIGTDLHTTPFVERPRQNYGA